MKNDALKSSRCWIHSDSVAIFVTYNILFHLLLNPHFSLPLQQKKMLFWLHNNQWYCKSHSNLTIVPSYNLLFNVKNTFVHLCDKKTLHTVSVVNVAIIPWSNSRGSKWEEGKQVVQKSTPYLTNPAHFTSLTFIHSSRTNIKDSSRTNIIIKPLLLIYRPVFLQVSSYRPHNSRSCIFILLS